MCEWNVPIKTVCFTSPRNRAHHAQNSFIYYYLLIYKGHPNYVSNMFSIRKCAYNLRGNGSRFDQPPPNTRFKHRSFSYIAC